MRTPIRVLVVAIVVGGGMALAAWSTTTTDSAGEQCASAWHSHPGSDELAAGGELPDAERAAMADECDRSGAVPWLVGWIALGAGAGVAAGAVAVLAVTGRRRSGG